MSSSVVSCMTKTQLIYKTVNKMWPLFYLPWLTTYLHPILGLATTTCFMVYHYTYKQQIVQRIELSILPNPVNIFRDHISKRIEYAPQKKTDDEKGQGGGQEELGESSPKMEAHVEKSPSKGDAGGEGTDSETKVKKKNHY